MRGSRMARHRARIGLTLSRARHRAPGPVQAALERGLGTTIVAFAAALLVISMVGSDPAFHARH